MAFGNQMPVFERPGSRHRPTCSVQSVGCDEDIGSLLEPSPQAAQHLRREPLPGRFGQELHGLLLGRMPRQKQPRRRHAGHLQRSGAQLGRQRHMPATHLWLGREARRFVEPLGVEVDFDWRDRGVHQRPFG